MHRTLTTGTKSKKRLSCWLGLHFGDELVRADFGYYWVCLDCRRVKLIFEFTE